MTRELKIALIVGFSLVLVVAVLVSDHLSKASRSRLASADAAAPVASHLIPTDPIRTAEDVALQSEALIAMAEGRPAAATELAMRQASREAPEVERAVNSGGIREAGTAFVERLSQANVPPALEVVQSPTAVTPSGLIPTRPLLDPAPTSSGLSESAVKPIEIADNASKPSGDASTGSVAGSAGTPSAANAEVVHTVAAGDSLYLIAKKYYGEGGKWKQIVAANPGRVSEKGVVRQGVKLTIPGATSKPTRDSVKPASSVRPDDRRLAEAAKRDLKADPKSTKAKPDSTVASKAATAPKNRPATYKVQPGDTAGKIAQRVLGSSRYADDILELNEVDEESLRVGMVLKLPGR